MEGGWVLNLQNGSLTFVERTAGHIDSRLTINYVKNTDIKTFLHTFMICFSTASKFSRHLIFHLPGAVFKDNIHVGKIGPP